MLKVENLYFSYNDNLNLLQDLNFEILKNEKVAFIGNIDDGTTVLFRILSKLEDYTIGKISYNDINLKSISIDKDISIAYLPTDPIFFKNKSVIKNLEYVLCIRNLTKEKIDLKIENALKHFDLKSIKDKKIKNLTKFERIKTALARIYLRNIDLFLIDNLFVNLTLEEDNRILEYLKFLLNQNSNSIFLLATKNENLAKSLCNKLIYLNAGSITKIVTI